MAKGKMAANEATKLRALFWNNLAVAAAATGIIIPLVAFYQTHTSLIGFVYDTPLKDFLRFLMPAVAGVGCAVIARARAAIIIGRMKE